MQQQLQEDRLLRDFVSPYFCEELISLGLPNAGKTYWLLKDAWHLWSYHFDPDHVYEKSNELIYFINPAQKPTKAFVAFTMGDILSALPPILITSTGPSDWEVSCDHQYGMHTCKAQRLPDALAKLLKVLIQSRKYPIQYITDKILQQ